MEEVSNKKYKIIISLIFGLLGFTANFFSIEIVNLSKIGFSVDLLWGLIFPLSIALAWGWKYALIAALSGGCQTMWWLWFTDGYGVLYSVPIFSLWIIWHGYWEQYNKKHKKMYINKYIIEIPFRIISAAGFYTVFRYLVFLNPPFWAADIRNNFVPLYWVNSVVLKHIVSAYIMLLIVGNLLKMNPVRRFFKLKRRYINDHSFIIYNFIMLGLVFWLLDTIIGYYFYYDSSFFDLLLFEVPGHELLLRMVVFLLCLISGLIVHKILTEKDVTEQKYKTLFNNIEDNIILSEYNREKGQEEIIEANEEVLDLLQYSKQELLSLKRSDIQSEEYENKLVSNSNSNSIKYESHLISRYKKEIAVEIKSRLFKLNEKEVILSIARDITARKKRINELQEQKEELSAVNQQLTAYSEEITAMNEELDESVKQINELNKRFVNMIKVVSNLDNSSNYDEESFLSDILVSAINIVPEADYGKICVVDNNDNCVFVDTVGHDYKLLKETRIKKDLLFHNRDKGIYTSDDYSLDINKIPEYLRETFISALKPISKSIYINITVDKQVVGRISLDIARGSNQSFSEETKHLLESFASIASAFFSFKRYNKLQGQFTKEVILSIIQILGMYDKYTSGHSENVARLAAEIAEEMGLSQKEISTTYWSGMVHDIGKLLIPINVLNKKEALTDGEYRMIKKHPYWGYKALSKSKTLENIAKYVLYHHERWDGTGYPEGIKGKEIPLISQILAVADAWDAMISKRAYRDPLSKDKAIKEIKKNKGKQFSPEVVDVFINNKNY